MNTMLLKCSIIIIAEEISQLACLLFPLERPPTLYTILLYNKPFSFLDILDFLPLPLQILVPQADMIITAANCQDGSAQIPAHPP